MLTSKSWENIRTILFFKNSSGKCPVEEFLDDLSGKEAQKITWIMQLIEEIDKVPAQYFKKLKNTEDIWEIRAQTGSNIFRILGFFDANIFIATNGFRKKSEKTPAHEIYLATKRKNEYHINQRRK